MVTQLHFLMRPSERFFGCNTDSNWREEFLVPFPLYNPVFTIVTMDDKVEAEPKTALVKYYHQIRKENKDIGRTWRAMVHGDCYIIIITV